MNHNPVGPVVHPPFVWVARDIYASGADVAATILVMPERRWELKHIDVAVLVNVIEERAFLHKFRRYGFDILVVVFPDFNEVHFGLACRKTERQRQPLPRCQGIGQHPVARWITLNIVKQNGGAIFLMSHQLRNGADFLISITAPEGFLLPHFISDFYPIS